MNRKLSFFSLLVSVIYLQAGELSSSSNDDCFQPKEEQCSQVCSKNCADEWSIRLDALCWQATEDGLEYAVDVVVSPIAQPQSKEWKEPDFKYAPGFRLGFEKAFRQDRWKVILDWTWYHSLNKGQVRKNDQPNQFVEQLWVPPEFGINPLKASARWDLWYNTLELLLKTIWTPYKSFCFTPFFGLKGVFIHQNLKTSYAGGDFSESLPIELHGTNNHNAGGLELGFDLAYQITTGWKICMKGCGSLYYGPFSVKEKVSGDNVLVNQISDNLFIEEETIYRVNSDVGASLGISWSPFQKNHTTIAFAYELIQTFSENQMRKYRNIDPETRIGGVLSLQGATLSLNINL